MFSSDHLTELSSRVHDTVAAYAKSNDASAYDEALRSIRDLQLAVERPGDFAARVRFQAFQNVALVMLAETGVLQAIVAKGGGAITANELATEAGCDVSLISLGGSGSDRWAKFMLDLQFRTGSRMMDYLRETLVHKGKTADQSALQFAFNGKSFWQLLEESPARKANFDLYMKAARRGGQVQLWHQRYPPAALLKDENLKTGSDALLMVDVGGGVSGQVGAFRKQYPDLPGRCVLQDLSDTIKKNSSPPENVELMAYDFFTAQPLKAPVSTSSVPSVTTGTMRIAVSCSQTLCRGNGSRILPLADRRMGPAGCWCGLEGGEYGCEYDAFVQRHGEDA